MHLNIVGFSGSKLIKIKWEEDCDVTNQTAEITFL